MVSFPGIPVSFHLMTKPVGALCNLECTYCYYLGKLSMYKETSCIMDGQVLEELVKQYIASQASPVVVFSWQGGEPCLAGPDFFQQVIYYQKKYAGNKKIENLIQTNGTLLDDQWCRFLKKHNFLVGISIDGPQEIHDFYRGGPEGRPSWERVMKGIKLLREHDVEFNTLTTVNAHSVNYPVEIYRFLKGIGSKHQQYSPVVERQTHKKPVMDRGLVHPGTRQSASLASWSVPSKKYGYFLNSIFDAWMREDIGKIFVQMFESTLASWLGEDPGQCLYRQYCGNALVMEQNGDIYACDHFVFPDHKRGNILERPLTESALSPEQVEFGYAKHNSLPGACRNCDYLFACHGECPRNRFLPTEEKGKELNYLCEGLKSYCLHVAPYMDFMVREIRAGRSLLGVRNFNMYGQQSPDS
jgi:uncharacterized protein